MKIEQNVNPDWANKKTNYKGPYSSYPLQDLKVGDVLKIPVEEQTAKFASIRTMVSSKQIRLRMRLVTRQTDDGTIEICRIA